MKIDLRNFMKKIFKKLQLSWEYLIKGQMLDSKQIENISKYISKKNGTRIN